MIIRTLADLQTFSEAGLASLRPDRIKISVGTATCGLAAGAGEIHATLEKRLGQREVDAILSISGCIGYCQKEPIVDVRLPGEGRLLFTEVTRPQARALVDKLARGEISSLKPWAYIAEEEVLVIDQIDRFGLPEEIGAVSALAMQEFFSHQRKIVLRNCGHIDPSSFEEYAGRGGYQALERVLSNFTPQQVIDEVIQSGLRGRGGGGFPTGQKWQVASDTQSDVKYIICNADEGDPGAYMDRTILESDPHSVIEGIIIGAYAIGAKQGYIYVRDEYPLAVNRITKAIEQAEHCGMLGENIFNSDFHFSLKLVRGAGAFVCGEETAMIASMQGGLGEPCPKPPYPAESGLWGRPTVINNVKTLASIPVILSRGADWFSSSGAEGNAGTVVFSLVGQVANTGLVEVPLGMALGELLHEVGGGSGTDKAIKAVQTGGPSGGCLPAKLFDLPVEYESLKEAGSMMGSGGMVVLDEDTCMVDIARYFLNFTSVESCGKCVACREGNYHLKEILTRIVEGQGSPEDLDLLEEVGEIVKAGSLCGLGQSSSNPVLSTLRYFREEYLAHVVDKQCSAGKCSMKVEV